MVVVTVVGFAEVTAALMLAAVVLKGVPKIPPRLNPLAAVVVVAVTPELAAVVMVEAIPKPKPAVAREAVVVVEGMPKPRLVTGLDVGITNGAAVVAALVEVKGFKGNAGVVVTGAKRLSPDGAVVAAGFRPNPNSNADVEGVAVGVPKFGTAAAVVSVAAPGNPKPSVGPVLDVLVDAIAVPKAGVEEATDAPKENPPGLVDVLRAEVPKLEESEVAVDDVVARFPNEKPEGFGVTCDVGVPNENPDIFSTKNKTNVVV